MTMNKYLTKLAALGVYMDVPTDQDRAIDNELASERTQGSSVQSENVKNNHVTVKPLQKIAKQTVKEDLQPHQVKALKQLEERGSVILDHSTGSGKTRTILNAALKAQEKSPNKYITIIAPASLTTNIDKEMKKHDIHLNKRRLNVLSYQKATNDADKLSKLDHSMVILDEAHGIRNTNTKRHEGISAILDSADSRVLATATMGYNKPSDIASLVNAAAGKKVLPEGKEFENRYIKTTHHQSLVDKVLGAEPKKVETLSNEKELKDILKKYVHHFDINDDPESKKHFPTKAEKTFEVEMTPHQEKVYRYVEGNLPFMLRFKIRNNLPLSKQEKASLNSFATGVRQTSNTTRAYTSEGEESPKIDKMIDNLHSRLKADKNYRGVVYSNYLESGLEPYSRKLKDRGVKHNVFTGSLSPKEKARMVEEYNSGKVPTLLVSSSGTEGLDLKGTKVIQIMEPHFNKSKLRQVMGRGVRYRSHEHLPENERHVDIEHYHTVYPKHILGKTATSIDKYLHNNAEDKESINRKIKELLK